MKDSKVYKLFFKKKVLLLSITFFILWVFIAPFIDNGFSFKFIYADSFLTKVIIFAFFSPLAGAIVGYKSK